MVHEDAFLPEMSQDVYVRGTKDGELDYSYITVGLGSNYRYISGGFSRCTLGLPLHILLKALIIQVRDQVRMVMA